MANDKVYIYNEENIRIDVYEEGSNNLTIINDNPSIETVYIYEPGPQGPRGEDGQAQIPNLIVTSSQQIDFNFIQNAPFYPIISGSLFGSTSSFAFFGEFSSSLLPWSSSFDLGSFQKPWKNIYATESIQIGDVKLTTSSINLDNNQVLIRKSNTEQELKLSSGSVSGSFQSGMFVLSDFNSLPFALRGGIIISGSDLFIGI